MTRLTTADLGNGPDGLSAYEQRLRLTTNLGLLELALKAANMTVELFRSRARSINGVAVIPISTGQGVIPGFSEKVAQVGRFLGLPCRVTSRGDVTGWGEAIVTGSEIILCADDEAFMAFNVISRRVVDNAVATGEIYAAALYAAAGGVIERLVGVLGLGPVGQAAAAWLHSQGANLLLYERDKKKQAEALLRKDNIKEACSVGEVLDQTHLVLDATNAPNLIRTKDLRRPLILSAPGMPLGIDNADSHMLKLIHDPLQLGVAAMMVQALA